MEGRGFSSRLLVVATCVMLVLTALVLPAAAVIDNCIMVTKECQDAAQPGDPITFSGTVTNGCAFDLSGVTVRDFVGGVAVNNFWFGTMTPGQSATFSGSYLPTVSPSTDTVDAYGYYFNLAGSKIWVHAYASATCSVQEGDGDGCTLTPGYWKTHSILGPAPYDDTWALLPDGEATHFFLSGNGYLNVLKTEPNGNAYYILARAFIAAELNAFSGASAPAEVTAGFAQARTLFETYTPAYIGGLRRGDALRATFINLAALLDGYNNGFSGPGHCSSE